MPQTILEKRSADIRLFDIDCSQLLDPTETITDVTSIAEDSNTLTFGAAAVNTEQIAYPDGTYAPTGKVVQVAITGGVVTPGAISTMYTVRALLQTSLNPAVEATVQLRVRDLP